MESLLISALFLIVAAVVGYQVSIRTFANGR